MLAQTTAAPFARVKGDTETVTACLVLGETPNGGAGFGERTTITYREG